MTLRRGVQIIGPLLFVGVIGAFLLLSACNSTPSPVAASTPVEAIESDPIVPATDVYGIPLDLYRIEEGRVRRNQTLSDLLQPFGLSMQEIYIISLLPDSLINERKIKQGNRFLFYSQLDTLSKFPLNTPAFWRYIEIDSRMPVPIQGGEHGTRRHLNTAARGTRTHPAMPAGGA